MEVLKQSPILKDILSSGMTFDPEGNMIPIHSQIKPAFAQALYENVYKTSPKIVVEVGMAFGVSTIAILTALRDLGGDRKLISIDPFQDRDWKNCGLEAVKRGNLQDWHQHIAEPCYLALPQLLREGTVIDFGYVDGWHTFDYTLLDFWYLDRMLSHGGIIGFNDCDFPSVHKVLRFITSHRRYRELDVGLRRNHLKEMIKACINTTRGQSPSMSYRTHNDRYFKKEESWEPSYNFFANF